MEELAKMGAIPEEEITCVSWLGVPLQASKKILGILSVQSCPEDRKFQPADVNTVLLFLLKLLLLWSKSGPKRRYSTNPPNCSQSITP
jgi:signal transduction protein with GAF and PtsI domain